MSDRQARAAADWIKRTAAEMPPLSPESAQRLAIMLLVAPAERSIRSDLDAVRQLAR